MIHHVRTRWLFCLLATWGCASDAAPHGANFVQVTRVSAGTCGNTASEFRCWGSVLGVNAAVPERPPAPYNQLRAISTNPSENLTCGLDQSSALTCWTFDGQPTVLAAGVRFTQVAVGWSSHCALATSGVVYCWGDAVGSGVSPQDTLIQDCDPESQYVYLCVKNPTPIASTERFTAVVSGDEHHCGLTTTGVVLCWGYGYNGQLGTGPDVEEQQIPAPVESSDRFTSLAASTSGACAVNTGGSLLCWGIGQPYADGTKASIPTPIAFPSAVSLTSVTLGGGSSCALDATGAAWCWGGPLGTGVNSATPLPVLGGLTFRSISAGYSSACGITDSGAWCWGTATGDGSGTWADIPVRVANQDQFDDD